MKYPEKSSSTAIKAVVVDFLGVCVRVVRVSLGTRR